MVKNSFIPSSNLKTHSFLFLTFWLWAQLDCENNLENSSTFRTHLSQIFEMVRLKKTRFVLGQLWQSANGRNDKTWKDINLKCETSWDNDVDQNYLDYEYFLKHEMLWHEIDIMNIPENYACNTNHVIVACVISFEVSSTRLYVNVDRNSALWIFLKTLNVMLLLHL